jgi:hypothetical protein
MANGTVQLVFFLTCMFLGCVYLLGVFTLFVRAGSIERNVMVGGTTLLFALIASVLVYHDYMTSFPYGIGRLLALCVFSTLGFLGGWLLEARLDADLAD